MTPTAKDGAEARADGFASRVAAAIEATGPLCVGIDPSPALLDHWGLEDTPDGLRAFGSRCLEACAGTVAAVKPQVAFFERFGAAGLAALEELLCEARDAGLLAIADAKRGDIGNTMAGYASAWLDPRSPLGADAMTAVPYLGFGTLEPLVETAARHARGVLVVVRSSNPEGRTVQEARTGSGTGPSVEDLLLSEIATANRGPGAHPGTVGAVIGATLERGAFPLPSLGGVVLAPGVGAQGATAADVASRFADCAPGSVLPSVSRSVLGAGPEVKDLAAAARRACHEMGDAMARARGA